jgi:Fe-Mn family superoxide dismutase
MAFELPILNYNYNELEPHIDARTMEIHHSKHHAGYTNNLNNAIAGTEFENKSIEDILRTSNLPNAIRNNGGGYYNHCLFWEILSPNPNECSNEFIKLIEKGFGGCDAMKEKFEQAAATRFGSGWAWLCAKNGELSICSTPNQDNPLMDGGCGGTPILGLDVWEHAYYLNYQNRRPDYIKAFWNIVNWSIVEAKYQASL